MQQFLPICWQEVRNRGWDQLDIILVTGDAYIDHPSFGAALIGRVLESAGYRVGILPQPCWKSVEPFRQLGRPKLFFGVTSGNLDSMVNNYTAHRRRRREDAFSPDGTAGLRPDRAVIVYTQRCREAFPGVPVIIGGLEASLRRLAHYDWWDNHVRRSILFDAKADLLVYGQAEKTILQVAQQFAAGIEPCSIHHISGVALSCKQEGNLVSQWLKKGREALVLPSYEEICHDRWAYARFSNLYHQEHNPENARLLLQKHKDRWLAVTPPQPPLTVSELDANHALPFVRDPHPVYRSRRIPAWESIKLSVQIVRGCAGGCSFCSLTQHQGRSISSRSPESISAEIQAIKQKDYFRGTISDLGGPTANIWGMGCSNPSAYSKCRRISCLFPLICGNFKNEHQSLISLYRKVRQISSVYHVFVASGLRYDLVHADYKYGKLYLEELVTHHVSGHLKVAPEHVSSRVLKLMHKPQLEVFEWFRTEFERLSLNAKKKQYLIPYFVSSHPGCTLKDAAKLGDYLRSHQWKPQQVQDFMPTPMTLATDMFYTGIDPLAMKPLTVARDVDDKKMQKALMRWDDRELEPWLRKANHKLGRKSKLTRKRCTR